jgi:hypothetical protein
MQICKIDLRNFTLNAWLRPHTVHQTSTTLVSPEIMALSTSLLHTLEPLPGEAARPPLRLLERREASRPRSGGQVQAPVLGATPWLQVLRRWVAPRG